MSTHKDSFGLLAHLSWRFHPRVEEVAVEALAFILNQYPDSRGGLDALVTQAVPDLAVSYQPFETELPAPDGTRFDLLQKGNDEKERLVIEAKLYAPLTPNQPVAYLNRLPADGLSALIFLAPAERKEELWKQLLGRLDESMVPFSTVASHCVAIGKTGKHLLVIDWTQLLPEAENRLKDLGRGLAELQQLHGLVKFAESGEQGASLPGKQLVNRVTDIGKASGWLDTTGLNATRRSYGFGRYVRLGQLCKWGVWLGVNTELHEEFSCTRLWADCTGWKSTSTELKANVRSRLKAHSLLLKEEGKTLWVAVVPQGNTLVHSYAAELERIAGILDETAEPQTAGACGLAVFARLRDQFARRFHVGQIH